MADECADLDGALANYLEAEAAADSAYRAHREAEARVAEAYAEVVSARVGAARYTTTTPALPGKGAVKPETSARPSPGLDAFVEGGA